MTLVGLLLACSSCASPAAAPIDPIASSYPAGFAEPGGIPHSLSQAENHGWMVGPVSSGTETGFSWTLFNESSQMTLEDESFGDSMMFDMRRTGLKLGYSTGLASFALVGLGADTTSQDGEGAETSGDWALGASGGLTFLPSERVGLGIDLTWLWGTADYRDAFDEGELDYMQIDSRIGIGYRPSADAMFALAPVVGVGYRVFDSAAISLNGPMSPFGSYDIDGESAYAFVGGSLAWRRGPGKTSMALEVLAMVGGVEGIMISIPFSTLDVAEEPKAAK